jgi:sterol desaturase/sphingolipid hydroxylase (fatty acid hydroxylase superfamily)
MVRRLQPGRRKAEAVRHDLRHSVVTLLLGAVTVAGTTVLVVRGRIPLDTTWPNLATVVGEMVAYVVLFDAYFYALHRVLHTRALYRLVHAVHHRSTAPAWVAVLRTAITALMTTWMMQLIATIRIAALILIVTVYVMQMIRMMTTMV